MPPSPSQMLDEMLLKDWRSRAAFVPLLAALFAPVSTLLDIPALTEPWFFENGSRLKDPTVNIALTAVSLFVNFVANALLVLRFSVDSRYWKWAMRASLVCWIVKLAIGIGNVLAFGLLTRNSPGITYGEGFWCAVVSIFINLMIVVLLLLHYVVVVVHRKRSENEEDESVEVQVGVTGRHFMLQTTLFIATIAVLALLMYRLEDWPYLQAIYFSIVTFLTIGFGDFSPTKTVTQILLFPFAIFGIIQIALLVDMIITFIAHRERVLRARRKARREKELQDEMDYREGEKEVDLVKEMQFLRTLHENAFKLKIMRDLIQNVSGFLLFWVLGALIFSQLENWTYGQGMYFSYVFFLSIGYGDFSPKSPPGQVIFVVYSLIAVPVMTTFAVQTIQSILRRVSLSRLKKRREEFGLEADIEDSDDEEDEMDSMEQRQRRSKEKETTRADAVMEDGASRLEEGEGPRTMSPAGVERAGDSDSDLSFEGASDIRERLTKRMGDWRASHAEFVCNGHRRIRKLLKQGRPRGNIEKEQIEIEDRLLTEYVLEQAVELERRARRLLLASMGEDTTCHTLLKADRIVRLRNIKQLARKSQFQQQQTQNGVAMVNGCTSSGVSTGAGNRPRRFATRRNTLARIRKQASISDMMKKYCEEEAQLSFSCELEESDMICEINKYRTAFANLLAAGGRLMKLKDDEQFMFEMRLRELENETVTMMSTS